MPAPYSDNLYSGDTYSDDEEQQDALSPTDGYFHASSSSPAAEAAPHGSGFDANLHHQQHHQHHQRTSDQVPHVPNVMVEDPTLREHDAAGAKAREAEQERMLNSPHCASSSPSPSPSPFPSTAAAPHLPPDSQSSTRQPSVTSPTGPFHSHRRSVEDDHDTFHSHASSASPLHTSPGPHNERTPLVQQSHPAAQSPQQQQQQRGTGPLPADAPPAYSPPERAAQPAAQPSPQQGYQTFSPSPTATEQSDMGVPEEERLLPRQPESMGGPPYGSKDATSGRRKSNIRSKLRTLLGVLVIFSIFFALFEGLSMSDIHIGGDSNRSPKMDDGDLRWKLPSFCVNKPHTFPKTTFDVDFNQNQRITLIQTIEDETTGERGWQPQVSGEVRVRSAPEQAPGRIELEVISNDETVAVMNDFDSQEQTLKLITPRTVKWSSFSRAPCIHIRATMYVPHEAFVGALAISTVQLDINFDTNLVFRTRDDTYFDTVSGDIRAPIAESNGDVDEAYTMSSRRIYLKTVSGDISGAFPLYDLLQAHTASGDIRVKVITKEVNSDEPRQAVLDLKTISGDIVATEPLERNVASSGAGEKEFNPRDFAVKIATTSGDVTAELAVSSEGDIRSISGTLNLRLWPVLDSHLIKKTFYSGLRTETKSGDQRIMLLEPYWTSVEGNGAWVIPNPDAMEPQPSVGNHDTQEPRPNTDEPWLVIHPHNVDSALPHADLAVRSAAKRDVVTAYETPVFSGLTSQHHSISGDIKLYYPLSWRGSFRLHTISGDQSVRGKNLTVTNHGGRFMRDMEGYKGDSTGSKLLMETTSGDQYALIGKE